MLKNITIFIFPTIFALSVAQFVNIFNAVPAPLLHPAAVSQALPFTATSSQFFQRNFHTPRSFVAPLLTATAPASAPLIASRFGLINAVRIAAPFRAARLISTRIPASFAAPTPRAALAYLRYPYPYSPFSY